MGKVTLLYKFSGITTLFSIAYYVVSLFLDFPLFTHLMLFDSFVFGSICLGAAVLPSQWHKSLTHFYIGFFVLETFVVSVFSGGPDSPVLPWFCITPTLALLLLGKKETFIWSSVAFVGILLLIPGQEVARGSEWYFHISHTLVFDITLVLGLLTMIVLLTWLFAERQKRLQLQLSESVEELKATEEELRQNMEELSATQDFLTESNVKLKDTIDLLHSKNFELELSRNQIKNKKEKSEQYNKVLNGLIRSEHIRNGALENMLKQITLSAANAMPVDRASIWLYNDAASAIECKLLYDRATADFESGMVLSEGDYPVYMQKIKKEEAIVAVDARESPYTCEFKESYLEPNHIMSMLDIPLMVDAQAIGVVCFEHRYTQKEWDEEDFSFAASIADLITISLQSFEKLKAAVRIKKQKEEIEAQNTQLQELAEQLLDMNQSLEERVRMRTVELEEKNRSFAEYTFINVHLLRAPMCQIMGLTNLLKYTDLTKEQSDLIQRLNKASKELESLIKKTTQVLEAGEKLDRTLL